MYENEVSKMTKKQNSIRIKTKPFKTNYYECFNRIASKSSSHNLAGNLYSNKHNNQMSPKKIVLKSTSLSQITFQNPQKFFHNEQLIGLNTRASHISNFSDINTELIMEKKDLENKIAYLKDMIAREKKNYAKTEINCKKNQYEIEKYSNYVKQLNIKSQRLNEGINQAKHDCNALRMNLQDLNQQNLQQKRQIQIQKNNNRELQDRCRMIKIEILNEDRIRGKIKESLIEKQVQMNKKSIYLKEDEQQRAHLLLEINNVVLPNKLDR